MLDLLLHRYRKHVLCIFRPFYENVTGEKRNALYALIRLSAQTTTSSFTHYQLEMEFHIKTLQIQEKIALQMPKEKQMN